MQREQKGQEIATHRPPERQGNLWMVPSQSGKGKYTVDLEKPSCTCPDFALRGKKCKHIYAALYTITPQTEASKTTTLAKKPTYRQDWPAYNVAQTNEKAYFQALLFDLCQGIAPPAQHLGRPRLSWQEMAFSAALKVYTLVSTRRVIPRMLCLVRSVPKGWYVKKSCTSSLAAALQLSEVSGANLETETMRIHVMFLQSWQAVIVEVSVTCKTVEDCMSFLKKRGYPISDGWLADLP